MEKLTKRAPGFILAIGVVPVAMVMIGVVRLPLSLVAAFASATGVAACILMYWSGLKIESRIAELDVENQTLADNNRLYEHLMSSTNDLVVLVDEAGRILEANSTTSELLGYAAHELTGHFLPDLAPPTERDRIKQVISGALQDEVFKAPDLMLNDRDGAAFWFDGRAGAIASEAAIVQIVLRDISESKRQFILTEKEISFLHELSRTLPLLQDFDQMLDRILGMLSETLQFNAFTLVLAEPDDTRATICVSNETRKPFLDDVRNCVADVLLELGDNIDANTVEYVIEHKKDIEQPSEPSVGSQIMLPLAIVNGVAGLFSSKPNAFKKEDLSLFSTMVSGISSLYLAYRSYQRVQHLSETDSLTGLFNRRKFFEELTREVERVSRYESPLSIIMLDIDHFKQVNDKYGHQMGDETLRILADVLRANTRKTDMVARYGGEEFIIMLPETPLKGSQGVAERILTEVEKATVLGGVVEINFTVSLGLAYFVPGDTVDTLVARTDQALYAAKENGRNRIELMRA